MHSLRTSSLVWQRPLRNSCLRILLLALRCLLLLQWCKFLSNSSSPTFSLLMLHSTPTNSNSNSLSYRTRAAITTSIQLLIPKQTSLTKFPTNSSNKSTRPTKTRIRPTLMICRSTQITLISTNKRHTLNTNSSRLFPTPIIMPTISSSSSILLFSLNNSSSKLLIQRLWSQRQWQIRLSSRQRKNSN